MLGIFPDASSLPTPKPQSSQVTRSRIKGYPGFNGNPALSGGPQENPETANVTTGRGRTSKDGGQSLGLADLSESEAILAYRESSRIARATQKNPVSKKKKKNIG